MESNKSYCIRNPLGRKKSSPGNKYIYDSATFEKQFAVARNMCQS